MQPAIELYPLTQIAKEKADKLGLTEVLEQLEHELKNNGNTMITAILHPNFNEPSMVWHFSIGVPGLTYNKAEQVVAIISECFCLDDVDNRILRSIFEHTSNILHLDWEIFA